MQERSLMTIESISRAVQALERTNYLLESHQNGARNIVINIDAIRP